MMSRQQFRATRFEHDGGYVYLPEGGETVEGLCIDRQPNGRLSVALGAGRFETESEEEAERVLFAWARAEGMCGPHAVGDEPDPVIPFRAFVATRLYSDNLKRDVPEAFDDDGDDVRPGYYYWGSGIIEEYEKDGRTHYHAVLGNYNPGADTLEPIERELYAYLPGLGWGYRCEGEEVEDDAVEDGVARRRRENDEADREHVKTIASWLSNVLAAAHSQEFDPVFTAYHIGTMIGFVRGRVSDVLDGPTAARADALVEATRLYALRVVGARVEALTAEAVARAFEADRRAQGATKTKRRSK